LGLATHIFNGLFYNFAKDANAANVMIILVVVVIVIVTVIEYKFEYTFYAKNVFMFINGIELKKNPTIKQKGIRDSVGNHWIFFMTA